MEGERDILGLWVGPTSGESPKFWLGVLSELKNRGVSDVLMLCCDGLKGLPDSARAVWPLVDVQLCVVHLVRNSLRFASKKHWGPITRQLKAIYTAPSLDAAEVAFEEFAADWETKYPAMVKSWRDTWPDFILFLEFPVDFRKIVYSTNAIESLNARFRKAAVRRGHFPTEKAAFKVLYLTSIERRKNRSNPTGRINGWKAILNMLYHSLQRPSHGRQQLTTITPDTHTDLQSPLRAFLSSPVGTVAPRHRGRQVIVTDTDHGTCGISQFPLSETVQSARELRPR